MNSNPIQAGVFWSIRWQAEERGGGAGDSAPPSCSPPSPHEHKNYSKENWLKRTCRNASGVEMGGGGITSGFLKGGHLGFAIFTIRKRIHHWV